MNSLMETAHDATKLFASGSVVAAATSAVGYVTADAVIPTIGAIVAVGMGIASGLKMYRDKTHQWEIEAKDRWIRALEQRVEATTEQHEKERGKLESRLDIALNLLRAWKDAAIAKGVTVDESVLIAQAALISNGHKAAENAV